MASHYCYFISISFSPHGVSSHLFLPSLWRSFRRVEKVAVRDERNILLLPFVWEEDERDGRRRRSREIERKEFLAQGRRGAVVVFYSDRKRVKERTELSRGVLAPKDSSLWPTVVFPSLSFLLLVVWKKEKKQRKRDTKGEMFFGADIQLVQAYQRLANNERWSCSLCLVVKLRIQTTLTNDWFMTVTVLSFFSLSLPLQVRLPHRSSSQLEQKSFLSPLFNPFFLSFKQGWVTIILCPKSFSLIYMDVSHTHKILLTKGETRLSLFYSFLPNSP